MDRRQLIGLAGTAAVAAALPRSARAEAPATAGCGLAPSLVPSVAVQAHTGHRARFYEDLVRGRNVLIHFLAGRAADQGPVLDNLARVQALLGDRMGGEVFFYSIATDPQHDTPRRLAEAAARHGAGPGWLFLTGEPADLELLRSRFYVHDSVHPAGHRHAAAPAEDCSRGLLRYGNAATGLWGGVPAVTDPRWIAERLLWMQPGGAPAGAPRRRGPLPRMAALLLALGLGLLGTAAVAQGTDPYQHPHPQPPLSAAPPPTCNGGVLAITTGTSPFPQSYPFIDPPGTNFLPTVYTDLYDAAGRQIPNTLPSTPTIPYNLLDGEPVVTTINPVSPADDLGAVFDAMLRAPSYSEPADQEAVVRKIQMGIDVLEGNPVPHRAYSGLPVLHYDGPAKVKQVVPVTDARGTVIGGNVDVHQVWYGGRIESDTAMIDLTPLTGLPNAADLTWTITYHVDVLSRGEDDFSPFVMYLDTSSGMGKPWIAMDQAFFPMQDGTRTVFKVKMAPSPNYSLVYTWGWRMHPPRAQVMENAHKQVTAFTNPCDSSTGTTQTTQQWEISVFGPDPRGSEANKLAAIAKIGDLAPEKKMWTALRAARSAAAQRKWLEVRRQGTLGKEAWFDFLDRTKLPGDLKPDPKSDLTLLYVNNTIYGEFTEGTLTRLPDYQTRGFTARITLLNGDNFPHGYQNVDFGGGRGWENQFKSSVKVGGSGCWFTFGRVYFSMLVPNVPLIPPAQGTKPSKQQVAMTFNFDPSRRLRFYQFDPLHHDTAIFSVH